MNMTLVTINVALPQAVPHGDSSVMTGIFKPSVRGPVAVHRLNLDGDGQADLVHHGGADKAVYAYSHDHYPWWREQLGRDDLVPGQFGENLTVAGLDEAMLCLGDQLQIGQARFVITQPRVPCFKLGIRFGDKRLPALFAQSLRTGVYLRVLDEGVIEAGDAVRLVAQGYGQLPIRALFDAYLTPNVPDSRKLLVQALAVPELSTEWRQHIGDRLRRRGHPAD